MEAQLTVEQGPTGRRVASLVPGDECALGQGPGAQLTLQDPALGARHASVRLDANGLWVVDLGCPGGTRLNDTPLAPRQPVEAFPGDALTLGSHVVRLTLLGRGARTRRRRPQGVHDPVVPAEEFELLRELGSGAGGVVYAARWIPHERVVALKVLREDIKPGSSSYERFVREAQTVARLNSPYVVAVYDVRFVPGRAYSIMEWVEGPSVWDVLKQGALPIHHALKIGEDVALALAAAAEEGIVHRDVKPANILLSPQGMAKLCDFGIAKDLDGTLHSLTTSGLGLGTMAYLPPEQVSDAKWVESSADTYALGATLYHLIGGRPPFSPTSVASLALILHEEPRSLAELRPDAPADVLNLIRAMLSKDPDDRPPLWKVAKQLRGLRESLYGTKDVAALFGGVR